MSTLAEIESALPVLSAEELIKLRRSIQEVEKSRDNRPRKSLLDLQPFDLGKMIKPITDEDDIFGEMIDEKRR